MIVVERPRQSGKTTILLHFMIINKAVAIFVAGTEAAAQVAFEKSKKLGLELPEENFIGMADERLEKGCEVNTIDSKRNVIMGDNADCITERYGKEGYELIAKAAIITITSGDK